MSSKAAKLERVLWSFFGVYFKTKNKPKRIKISKLKRDQARSLVHDRLSYFNNFYQLSYNRVFIRNQKSRWGSCSSQKNLNFNYRIIELDRDLQDYLVVHELCHLKHFNHGKEFWDLVSLKIPNYKELKKRLNGIQ